MHDHHSHGHTHTVELPSSTEGLPDARRPEVVELADGDEFELEIAPVTKQIGDATVRMLAYNGSVPGPDAEGPAGRDDHSSTSPTDGDLDATVHWHGLRLENRYDGTHETQAPIPVGRDLHLPGERARSGRLLVPPAHPRGLRPGDGPLREHPRRPDRGRPLAARPPRAPPDARRRPDRGRADRPLQRLGDDARRDGPLRQRHARRRRTGAVAEREARRGRALLLHRTRPTRASSTSRCRGRG